MTDPDAHYTLRRWTTIDESYSKYNRTLAIKRVVYYRLSDSGGVRFPSDRNFSTPDAALEAAERIMADYDGRGQLQLWQEIDQAGLPVRVADEDGPAAPQP